MLDKVVDVLHEVVDDILFDGEILVDGGVLIVTLNVVLTTSEEPGRSKLPM